MFKKFIFTLLFSVMTLSHTYANSLPNVTILATGGTIAATASSATNLTDYKAGALTAQQIIDSVPGLSHIANIKAEQIANVDSNNLTFDTLLTLAKRINTLLATGSVNGIVITHGTDTLEETAFFLNLTVKSEKPVVIVGAMRPASGLSADGPLNLLNAVAVAGNPESNGRGVLVVMNGQILAARDVTKTNTLAPETFKANDLGMLGYVADLKPVFYRESTRKHTTESEFDVSNLKTLPRVDILYQYLNVSPKVYKAVIATKPAGIIVAATGNGSISKATFTELENAVKDNIIVVRSSRVGSGIVTPTEQYTKSGFINADNLNPQKARILLTLALTQTKNKEKIQEIFAKY